MVNKFDHQILWVHFQKLTPKIKCILSTFSKTVFPPPTDFMLIEL